MKYLFFDIECANLYKGESKICSFGYVLTDENFNLIKKENILINPNSEWDKFVLRNVIHYNTEIFLNQPLFNDFYPYIKKLLTSEDILCFGYGVSNDVKFLKDECSRYNLEKLEFTPYDIQKFYKLYTNDKLEKSISKAINELNIELNDLQLHDSLDDAYMTMLIAKQMCINLNISMLDLINISMYFISNELNQNITKKINRKIRELTKNNFDREKETICFSELFEEEDYKNDFKLIKRILNKGYNYSSRVKLANYYVSSISDSKRDFAYKSYITKGINIKLLNKTQLKNLLNNTKEKEITHV